MANEPSIRLFESLDFRIEKRIEVFSEVQLRWSQLSGDRRNDNDAASDETRGTRSEDPVRPQWLVALASRLATYDAAT